MHYGRPIRVSSSTRCRMSAASCAVTRPSASKSRARSAATLPEDICRARRASRRVTVALDEVNVGVLTAVGGAAAVFGGAGLAAARTSRPGRMTFADCDAPVFERTLTRNGPGRVPLIFQLTTARLLLPGDGN